MPTTGIALHTTINEISMIAIWIETVIYGVNCIMYGMSMFILSRGGKLPAVRWVLLLMSTMLFLLCSAHVGASLRQLLVTFFYTPADVPYATTYWIKPGSALPILKNALFGTLVSTQDLILIWRLYVVFMYDWRVVILPLVLETAYMAIAYAATLLPDVSKVDIFGLTDEDLSIAAIILNLVLNLSVTVAIATRLWWMGHNVVSLTATRTNRYVSLIHIIVESGAIFSATSLALLVLFITKNIVRFTALNVVSQVAALTPFLIVVRIGQIGPTHPCGGTLKSVIVSQDGNMPRTGIHRELDLQQHFSPSSYPLLSPSESPSYTHSTYV